MAERPSDDANARSAVYLADTAAHVDDPDHGDDPRR